MHDLLADVHERRDVPTKKRLGVFLVCGLGVAFTGCGSDTGARPATKLDGSVAVDVGIMPLPVLDPNGTYGGKTVAEWGGEWQKWIYEYPGPESLAFNTPGATCEMGQSMATGNGSTDGPPFFLGIWDFGGPGGGTFTQACAVPVGRTILFQLFANWDDNIPECASGGTEQNCLSISLPKLRKATALELEIDGKSYGSKVADFAPYLTGCTHLFATIPNTPGNHWLAYYGCTSTQSVLAYDAWQTGYWFMLAPLAPGPHVISASEWSARIAPSPARRSRSAR